MQSTIKADLHMHGAIGFQDYWLKVQGYKGKNLLQLLSDKCFEQEVDLCAITSEEFEIPKGSIHDRLNVLKERYASKLPWSYGVNIIGRNIFSVEKSNKKVYFINGQTVVVNEDGKRYDHLVIGSNQVPNNKDFADTIKYCNDNGLIHGLEHPILEPHFGVGSSLAEKILSENYVDFVEGHNAQLIHLEQFSFIPIIGKYNRGINKKARELAKKYNKPSIATSDAHNLSGIGSAYIEFNGDLLSINNEEKFIDSLKNVIGRKKFSSYEGYQDAFNWFKWSTQFVFGAKLMPKEDRTLVSEEVRY